ncbi:MAG: hypothetical protein FWD49_02600 [Firmicutes bacterium]|nr:hypothetical protein [Bacillota bacterium]
MESFFEKFAKREINIAREIATLERLLSKLCFSNSVLSILNGCYLRIENKFRNNAISHEDFLAGSGLDKIAEVLQKNNQGISVEYYKCYLEYLYGIIINSETKSLIMDFWRRDKDYRGLVDSLNAMLENIENSVERLNHKIVENSNGFHIIVEKDYAVTQATEIVGDKYELGEKMYLFHHHSLKGDLNAKSDILCRLYKYFETIKDLLKTNNHTALVSNIGLLSQKTDTRHAPNAKQATIIGGKTNQEMEEIYNTAFALYLEAIIHSDYLINHKTNVDKWVRDFSE